MAPPSSPKDKFYEKVINPYLPEVMKHPQAIEMREGCFTSGMFKDPTRPGAWRPGLKWWSRRSSSAKGWWSVDLAPTTP